MDYKNQEHYFEYMTNHTINILGQKYMKIEDVVNMLPKYFVEKQIAIAVLAAHQSVADMKKNTDDPLVLESFKYLEKMLEMIISDARDKLLFKTLEETLNKNKEEVEEDDNKD